MSEHSLYLMVGAAFWGFNIAICIGLLRRALERLPYTARPIAGMLSVVLPFLSLAIVFSMFQDSNEVAGLILFAAGSCGLAAVVAAWVRRERSWALWPVGMVLNSGVLMFAGLALGGLGSH